jgi:membrane-associated phospholipid phosphatase
VSHTTHPVEEAVFRRLNELPDHLYSPLYVVMQAGSLGAVFATAAIAAASGRRSLATRIALTGVGVWAGAKVMKRQVGRGRPAQLLDDVTVRGKEEGDLGFPSGHAAVAFCLAGVIAPELPPALRPAVWATATTVAAARVYVGAHLPLDVIGGAMLGAAAATATATAAS